MDKFLNNEYNSYNIIEKLNDLDKQLLEEQQKDDNERNKEREFELLYAKLIHGMKLNTGGRFY